MAESRSPKTDPDDGLGLKFWLLAFSLGTSAIACLAIIGCSVAYVTPYFVTQRLPEFTSSMPWMAQPVCLLVIGLPLAIIQDRFFCPGLGRRRPWLILFVIFVGIGFAAFPNSHILGGGMGTLPSQIIAVVSYWILIAGLQGLDVSYKALIVDVVPVKKQLSGVNAVLSFFGGMGTLTAFGVGAIPFVDFIPVGTLNIQPVFFCCLLIVLIGVGITVCFVHETRELSRDSDDSAEEDEELLPLVPSNVDSNPSEKTKPKHRICGVCFTRVLQPLFKLPCAFWTVFLAIAFSNCAKAIAYVFLSDFVGSVVFEGDPLAALGSKSRILYEDGVRWCSLGLVGASAIGIAYALLLHFLMKCIHWKILWIIGDLIFSLLFFVASFIRNRFVVLGCLLLFGISQTTMLTIGWSLTNVMIRGVRELRKSRSFVQNLFGWSMQLPQFVIALVGGALLNLFQSVCGWGMESIFVLGGILAALAIGFVMLVFLPKGIHM